ncbi:MAG: hypothetical protein J0M15_05405 [Deltaproteobacteria bacterium]|nr:hypothetical protein [Deltaproteobacteria bacterium]
MTNIKTLKFIFFIFSFFFLTSSQVFATGAGITYNGRILNPNGDPVQGNSVQFKLQIRTIGNENCLMYEEVQVKDMSGSDGVFTLTINDGSGTRLDSAAYGLDQIFANRGTFSFPTNYCASGNSYAPNPSDGRKLQVYFNDGTIPAGEWEPSPAMAINFIPSAIEAMQVGGYKKEQLLKLADGVSTTGSELDATKWTNLQALLAGSSSQYVTPGSATFTAAPSWSGTPSVGTDLVNKTYVDAQVAAGLPDVGTPGTYGKVTTDAKGRVTSGAALVEADIPTLSTAGKVSGSAINTGTVGGNAAINTTGNLVTTGTVSGQTLSATQLRVYNGANYLQFTSPTLSGITNFILPPGDSTGTQYLRSDGAGNLSWGSPGSVSLTQAANQGVTITGTGPISLGTVQDIRTTASPTFAGMILNNVATNLTQSVSVGTSYGITWPGSVASTAGSVLTSTTGGLLSWTAAVPAANGGTGQSSYTIGDLLYASTSSALSRLPASTSGYVLTSNGAGTAPSWQAAAGGGAISALTAAASTNSIDNTNYAQTWNWSTATTENPMVLTANALTTGSLLSVSTSNGSLNSTNGLLNVANTGASTSGVLARLQSNSTSGSGLTVLANGNVGIGNAAPAANLHLVGPSGTTLKIVDGNQANGRVLTSDSNGVASWAVPSTGGPAPYTENFETWGGTNPTNFPVGWTRGGGGATQQSTSNVVNGSYSVQLTGSGSYIETSIDITGYKILKATVVVGNSIATIAINGTNIWKQTGALSSTVIEVDISSYSGTVALRFQQASISGGNNFYIDELSLKGGGESQWSKSGGSLYSLTNNVGIGITNPQASLEVAGQTRSVNPTGASQTNGTAAIDWNNGNAQTLSVDCATTTFTNMLDAGTYILAVTETGTSTCVFSQAGLTFYFSPANGARTSGQRTVYSFQRIGNDVYVSWIKGFQ